MDTKLTGKAHVQAICERAQRHLNLRKRVMTVTWGANQVTLLHTNLAFIRLVLEYGCKVFVASAPSVMEPLNIVQNQALRLITGGVKTTPIVAMEMTTGIPPLQVRRETAAIIEHEKLIRLDDSWCRHHLATKTQHTTFIQKVNNLKTQYIPSLKNCRRKPISFDRYNQLINFDWYDTIPALKFTLWTLPTVEIRKLATQHIQHKYPHKNWLHVYMDGSATPDKGSAGVGWHSLEFEGSAPAGKSTSALTSKVAAILHAITTAT